MSSGGQGTQPCQFSGEACSTQSTHYRKVISHIFGRNKKCTIGIPDYVWIYYCRKHYQRARYRTGEWPFRQCDLAMDTVRNMQAWGGVESFNLQLRRRETRRTSSGAEDTTIQDGESSRRTETPPTQALRSPTNDTPRGETADPGSPSETPSPHLLEDEDITVDDETPKENDAEETTPTSPPPRAPAKATTDPKKKRPTIIPRPVPEWLHSRIGTRKSFAEVLNVMRDLRHHLLTMSERGERPHFPDIEILPNLRPRAAVDKSKNRNKAKGQSRVGAKGAVKKTEKQNK